MNTTVFVPTTPSNFSKEQAAVYLGISLATINRLIQAGVIPTVKVGQRVRIEQADLDTYLISSKKTN